MATMAGRTVDARAERAFFFWAAFAMIAAIFIGFAATWFLRPLLLPAGALPLTPFVWLHGLLFTAWVALFMTQVSLVSARRVDLHRRLGLAGIGFAIAMPIVGLIASATGALRGSGPAGFPPMSFMAVPFFAVVAFVPLLVAALRNRHNPVAHKRLMLLTMVIFTAPGFGRMSIFPGPSGFMLMPFLFIAALWVWDKYSLGRIHKATLWGSLVVAASLLLPVPIGSTKLWLSFAGWATGLIA